MTKLQSIKSKKGEVEFRKKLTRQFSGKCKAIKGHPNQDEHLKIIRQRVKETRQVFKNIKKKGVTLSPYLEIGAEIGHRSMILENEFNAEGFISDISYESLTSAHNYLKPLSYKNIPKAVCCDAYQLPFPSSSIPFIFCYQTLHHFPDPKPIIKEIYRVLTPGGHFYFSEEPISQKFNLNLWRRDLNLTWYEKILKKMIILHFLSKIGKTEVEHDIHEEDFDLPTWEKALNVFDHAEVTLKAFPYGPSSILYMQKKHKWLHPPLLKNLPLQILGGGITALCRKKGKIPKSKIHNLEYLLACPNCSNHPKLKIGKKFLYCKICKSTYKKSRYIYLLLPIKTQQALYGEK